MTCRVTVRSRDAGQQRDLHQWELDDWTALVVLASLSSEPESLNDLYEAIRRYQPEHALSETGRRVTDIGQAVGDEMWCLVDLVGRTVVAGNEFDLPNPAGAYEPLPDEKAEGFRMVWLDTPPDWLFRGDGVGWRAELDQRAAVAASAPRIDARAVLFGNPMLEFLAERTLAAADDRRRGGQARELELTREIHADWLLSAREDLGGKTPRQVLLAHRERIILDIEHRSQQWSRQGHATPPLPTSSNAYRYGGFGTIEISAYFDLIRALLGFAWQTVIHQPKVASESLIGALVAHRDRWLREPDKDSGMQQSPSELIEIERRRLPVTSDESHFDCDCPICRAQADGLFGSGPSFIFFDGLHLEMEDHFAFSLKESYQEWKADQFLYQDPPNPDQNAAEDESVEGESVEDESVEGKTVEGRSDSAAATLTDDDQESGIPGEHDSVWKSSYVDWNQVAGPGAPKEQSLFALAFPLAEIISDLKGMRAAGEYVGRLNEAYDALRRSDDCIASESAARQLVDVLEQACQTYPELTSKCADFQSRVDEILRRLV